MAAHRTSHLDRILPKPLEDPMRSTLRSAILCALTGAALIVTPAVFAQSVDSTEANAWELVINQAVDLPFGASFSQDYELNLEGNYQQLKVELRDDSGTFCGGVTEEVDISHTASRGVY